MCELGDLEGFYFRNKLLPNFGERKQLLLRKDLEEFEIGFTQKYHLRRWPERKKLKYYCCSFLPPGKPWPKLKPHFKAGEQEGPPEKKFIEFRKLIPAGKRGTVAAPKAP